MEYIIGQQTIDKSIFKLSSDHFFGIGCACNGRNTYTCMFLAARYISPSDINERIPVYQEFLNSDQCIDKCHYFDRTLANPLDLTFYNSFWTYQDVLEYNICPATEYVFSTDIQKECMSCV